MATNLTRPKPMIIYLAFIALLVLGWWLRLRFIQTVQLYPDEFVTLLAVQMIGEKGTPVMPSGLFYDHGLLFSYAGSLAAWFGPMRWAVRCASLLFGLLTLGLTFWLGRRWFSPAVGLIAVTGMAVAPAAIEWSGRARMYALLQLLVLATLWLAYEGIVQNKARWRWAALLAYLGATLTHFVAVTLAPPLVLAGVAVWWGRGAVGQGSGGAGEISPPHPRSRAKPPVGAAPLHRLKDWKLWLEAAALILVLIIAFLVKRAGQPKGIEALDTTGALPGLAQVFAIYANFSINPIDGWQAIAPFYLNLPALIFTPFVIIAIVVSLIQFFTPSTSPPFRPSTPPPFLSLILLITTLEMILFVSPDRRDDKYLFMLLPVLCLLGAQGLAWIGGRWSVVSGRWSVVGGRWSVVSGQESDANPPSSILHPPSSLLHPPSSILHLPSSILHPPSSILPLLISGLIITAAQPAVRALLANTGDDYDSAFAYVRAHWQEGDTIFTGTPAAAAFYLGHNDFYGVQRRGGYDYRLLTINGQAVDRWLGSPAVRTEAELHDTLANRKVWLVLERWGLQREYYDPAFQQQLLAQTDPIGEDQPQGIFILHSRSDPRPLTANPAHPLEANFANLVQLTGYTVEPEQPAPGESLRLTLYWQALAALPHDYTVFVHLRKSDNGTVAQADHRPLDNLYPTSLWPVGEMIRESSQLTLPADLPANNYELWIGLYLLETGQRLPVQKDNSGENAVRLGEISVEP